MENNENLEPQARRWYKLMTSNATVVKYEFFKIISSSDYLRRLEYTLERLDRDLFVKIITTPIGSSRVLLMLKKSADEIHMFLFFAIMSRFTEIMSHRCTYGLALQILNGRNIDQKNIFCYITYRDALLLASNEHGCLLLHKVITIADDGFKGMFLDLIAYNAHSLSMDYLGLSLIQHMLKLEFTLGTTQENTRLHALMAAFDEILSTPDHDLVELHKLASKLTSDSDLFVDFVKSRRGLLMAQSILGKSGEIDMMFFEAVKQRFTDVMTDMFGSRIMIRVRQVFEKRGTYGVINDQIIDEVERKALHLTKDPIGSILVHDVIDCHNLASLSQIAIRLRRHYIEVSFEKHGSSVVERLLDDNELFVALSLMTMDIRECDDEDTLVRLAKNEYGNKILKKALEVAKEHKADKFHFLVEKLKPILGSLRGSQGENIAAIIDSEIKDQIVSQENN